MYKINRKHQILNKNDIFWITVTILNISNALDVYVVAYPSFAIAICLLIAGALKVESNGFKGPLSSVLISGVTHILVGNYINASIFIALFIISFTIYYRMMSDQ